MQLDVEDLIYFKLRLLLDRISFKFQRFTPPGCKDMWIRKLKILENTELIWPKGFDNIWVENNNLLSWLLSILHSLEVWNLHCKLFQNLLQPIQLFYLQTEFGSLSTYFGGKKYIVQCTRGVVVNRFESLKKLI